MRNDNVDNSIKEALAEALATEYAWVDSWRDEQSDHVFSKRFIDRMEHIKLIAEREYIGIGRFRITRLAACALIAVTLIALAGCGLLVREAVVYWNETHNLVNGALDITFDIEDSDKTLKDRGFIEPPVPSGFKLKEKIFETNSLLIEYVKDDGKTGTTYTQQKRVDTIGLSIDSDDKGFRETTVNGFKGYISDQRSNVFLIWSDGIYLYTLSGNCSPDILWEMAEEIK